MRVFLIPISTKVVTIYAAKTKYAKILLLIAISRKHFTTFCTQRKKSRKLSSSSPIHFKKRHI